MKQILAVFAFCALSSCVSFAQVTVKYVEGQKTCYHAGDVIKLTITVKLNPNSCREGADKTYIYFAGCRNLSNEQWKTVSKNVYSKDLTVKIADKVKKKATITIVRNTDKESFTEQEIFKINN